MILYTCRAGLSLMRSGIQFGAWDVKTNEADEYAVEVPENAAVLDEVDYEDDYEGVGYTVIRPELCRRVKE